MSSQPNGMPQPAAPTSIFVPNPPRKSWLGRNWIWLLGTLFLGAIVFAFGIFALIVSVMRGSDVAKDSVAKAQANAIVAQRLGTPISEGWLVSGSVNVSTGTGDADLAVPISGPKGKGTVYATAHMNAGVWTYDKLQAGIEGSSERIDLLAAPRVVEAPVTPPPALQGADVPTQPAQTEPSVAMAATPQPAAPAPDPAPAATPGPSGGVIASAQYANDPNVRCDLLELKRVSGGALLARWRIVNTGTKAADYEFGWDDIYYIDPAGNKKYNFLTIDGKRILDVWWGWLQPGEQHVMWAKYPAPPPTSKRISLNVPKFTPFEDIPVSE